MHANTPSDVPARLEALGLLGGLPRLALHAQVAAALQVVFQIRRTPQGRVLESICLLLPEGPDRLVTAVPAWVRGRGLGLAARALGNLIRSRDVPVPPILCEPWPGSAARSGAPT
ncbi:pilus assembly protein CpaF [Micromonospora phaseoli]|uniref:Pilus assembly protein CpaF n=1 Tax=Micromonospora phaseoli TaxID=1144548 RepID=A0A1H7AJU4_9ACTN|nr:hypothetical protein CLV64_107204 [Micromonospora phaseoli]SEJ65869.1 pilus assembly protein CpaF [Micromonospora phaseoli]